MLSNIKDMNAILSKFLLKKYFSHEYWLTEGKLQTKSTLKYHWISSNVSHDKNLWTKWKEKKRNNTR
jgi:hypothetical protein